ncbi:MAG: hypothetical protein IT435_12040 [Phycisphaerales bacterium]|nr:hypothetical protein [Phycisphaerales bacterium]
MERLATGKRINRAADDPAGSIITDKLTGDIKSLEKQIEGYTRELGYLAAKDGAHSAVGDMLVDLQGLVVSAANRGAMSKEELDALQLQANSIIGTIDHLAGTQIFNEQKLLDEAHSHQLGEVTVTTENPDGSTTSETKTLADIANGGDLNLRDGDLEAAQEAIEAAIADVASTRGAVGARGQDLESQIRTSQSELENLSATRSQIADADYALEISAMIRTQTLQQASIFMMQMMMQSGEQVLGLISGTTGNR